MRICGIKVLKVKEGESERMNKQRRKKSFQNLTEVVSETVAMETGSFFFKSWDRSNRSLEK